MAEHGDHIAKIMGEDMDEIGRLRSSLTDALLIVRKCRKHLPDELRERVDASAKRIAQRHKGLFSPLRR